MSPIDDVLLDTDRQARIGIGEAVLCEPKSVDQIERALEQALTAKQPLLLTRLGSEQHAAITARLRDQIDYEPASRTGFFGKPADRVGSGREVAVVTGGSSDTPVAREAVRTLEFNGIAPLEVYDVGVAGLWRLQQRVGEIAERRLVIAVAGMDAALPTVLAGLIPSMVIAVPTSVGYGVAAGGETAMRSLLASCAQGIVVVNVDNGFGAACAALRALDVAALRASAKTVAA